MVLDKLLDYGAFLVIGGIILFKVIQVRLKARGEAAAQEKGEALFRSMFPELQPHFHPRNAIAYVLRRGGNGAKAGRSRNPEGFDGAAEAEVDLADGKERVTLLDAGGATLASFLYEDKPDGGVLRIGKGKMTVTLPPAGENRVRYWHPDREFKWKRGVWSFTSRMADRDIESGDSDRTSFSSDSSSSSSFDSGARSTAAAAGIVAAGGAFDGGGANASWDGTGSAESGSGGEAGTATATAY